MDAPERIWAEPDGDNIIIHNGSDDLEGLIATGYLTEYIRSDLAAPDLAELVEALRGLLGLLDAGSLYEPQAYRARAALAKIKEPRHG